MTTRRMLQKKPQGKHRPAYVTPYVSIFGIPEGGFGALVFGGRRARDRLRRLTVDDIINGLVPLARRSPLIAVETR